MKIFLLSSLTLVAFAANSLLARAGLLDGEMDGLAFTIIRLLSGAAMLSILIIAREQTVDSATTPPIFKSLKSFNIRSWLGSLCLLAYAAFFSLAYVQLSTGLGALCLFAAVQLTILILSARSGQLGFQDVAGAGLASLGLTYLVWPTLGSPQWVSVMIMLGSGAAWGGYTWLGRGQGDPLQRTQENFLRAGVLALPLIFIIGLSPQLSTIGIVCALLSGTITSGLGYALWYYVLPKLTAASSGVSQLLVPPIAALMGWAFLGENLSLRFWLATSLILLGLTLTQSRNWRSKRQMETT